MVRIRLTRVGLKKQPSYRIVVNDIKKARDSRYIENIGFYNPRTQPETITVHEDRVLYWLSVGAQPTDSVRQLLGKIGTLDRFARLKAGEDMESLVAEARAAAEAAEPISGRTQYPAPQQARQAIEDAVSEATEETDESVDQAAEDQEAEANATE